MTRIRQQGQLAGQDAADNLDDHKYAGQYERNLDALNVSVGMYVLCAHRICRKISTSPASSHEITKVPFPLQRLLVFVFAEYVLVKNHIRLTQCLDERI